ncbi:MAG: EF-hand domain-containing protein [Pseudomonadota bacterium]
MLAIFGSLLATTVSADSRNGLGEDKLLIEEADDSGLDKTLEHNFSPDDRARLRKALADYARSTDPEHSQIELKRKAMQESIEKRFNECNKDNDDSLDREESTLCLPQIARHFNYVDVDEDGVITLEEMQLAQAKLIERQKAAEARMEAQNIQDTETAIKNKSKAKDNKQASNIRKRPS